MVKLHRYVGECEAIPWWLGVAYWDPIINTAKCYVVPVNLIVRYARNAWLWLRAIQRPDLFRAQLIKIRMAGYNAGYEVGYRIGHRAGAEAEMHRLEELADDLFVSKEKAR